MATRLNQILAVRQSAQSEAAQRRAELLGIMSQEGLFSGLSRTYQGRVSEQDGGAVYAGKIKKVQVTVPQVIVNLGSVLSRLLDVELTQDVANTAAKADIVVTGTDGKQVTLATGVPTTYLLFLERQLKDLREFVSMFPVLDPAQDWNDKDTPPGQHKTDVIKTDKTKKVRRNHVKFAGDQYHEPQIDTYDEDTVEGQWHQVDFSGAVPAQVRQQYLDRISVLQRAVKYAREEANSAEIHDVHIGADLLKYVFA